MGIRIVLPEVRCTDRPAIAQFGLDRGLPVGDHAGVDRVDQVVGIKVDPGAAVDHAIDHQRGLAGPECERFLQRREAGVVEREALGASVLGEEHGR